MNISFSDRKLIQILLITLWFGLFTGLLEVLLLLVKQQLFHVYIFRSRDFLWLTPLANVFLFSIPGLLMFLGALCSPRIDPIPGLIFLYSFLGAASIFMEIEKFSRPVVVLIALVVSINTARLFHFRLEGFKAIVGRTLFWLIGAVIVLALVRLFLW